MDWKSIVSTVYLGHWPNIQYTRSSGGASSASRLLDGLRNEMGRAPLSLKGMRLWEWRQVVGTRRLFMLDCITAWRV